MNIVLIPGLLASRAVFAGNREYFLGVPGLLARRLGARTFTPDVPPLGTVAERASALGEQIAGALSRGVLDARSPLHLVAHSMGGLDCRFLVSHDIHHLQDRVATVTCIGTPHLGCPSLTALVQILRAGWTLASLSTCWMACDAVRTSLSILERVIHQDVVQLDGACPDVAGVRYFDVAGVGRGRTRSTALFFLPTSVLLNVCGETQHDGLVPVRSACRNRVPLALWNDDHAGLAGHDLDWPFAMTPPPSHLTRYEALATVLRECT